MKNRSLYIIAAIIGVLAMLMIGIFEVLPISIQKYLPLMHKNKAIDTLEFAPNHPSVKISALEQLSGFPAPQFKNNHQLLPNFLWMDPRFLGDFLQPNCNLNECVKLSSKIQAELATNWHYYYLVNSNLKSFNSYRDTNSFTGSWVKFANQHKNIPVAAISFCVQVQPNKVVDGCKSKMAYIINNQLPDCCYVQNKKGEVISRKYPSPLTPLSQLQCDFSAQSIYIDSLLSVLKRPIQMINDNGEVFRLYEDYFLEQDAKIVSEKNKFPQLNWNEFQAKKRLEKEIAFRNSFMLKPALANCIYTQYAIDGQNKYRHDYGTVRKINSAINQQYYATPDFYPRYPNNWKKWQGPWHGLKWLSISRKTEIELGDNLFSPYVAAGWDSIEENNIRPAQWLGLLKLLGAMGAEFYYSGFFNTSKVVAKPQNYIWQAAMPVYAQSVTSFYEDILRNGTMLAQDDYIQYPENDVPTVIRKSKNAKTWVIACSWQTGTNYNKNAEEAKTVLIDLGHKKIKVNARRQGSVYVYSEEKDHIVFYQIDGWHQYMHPYYWSKNIVLEAELYTSQRSTHNNKNDDYTNYTSYAKIDSVLQIPFSFHGSSKKIKSINLWLKNEEKINNVTLILDGKSIGNATISKKDNLLKYEIPMQTINQKLINGTYLLSLIVTNPGLLLDKIEIINE